MYIQFSKSGHIPKNETEILWHICMRIVSQLVLEALSIQGKNERAAKKKRVSIIPRSCLARHQTCAVSHLYVPGRYDRGDRGAELLPA